MARPKEFDPDEVLDRALDVFWEKGFEGTSVQDLVDHMGINRGSIYGTFGDKHRLFQQALERYFEISEVHHLPDSERVLYRYLRR